MSFFNKWIVKPLSMPARVIQKSEPLAQLISGKKVSFNPDKNFRASLHAAYQNDPVAQTVGIREKDAVKAGEVAGAAAAIFFTAGAASAAFQGAGAAAGAGGTAAGVGAAEATATGVGTSAGTGYGTALSYAAKIAHNATTHKSTQNVTTGGDIPAPSATKPTKKDYTPLMILGAVALLVLKIGTAL